MSTTGLEEVKKVPVIEWSGDKNKFQIQCTLRIHNYQFKICTKNRLKSAYLYTFFWAFMFRGKIQ